MHPNERPLSWLGWWHLARSLYKVRRLCLDYGGSITSWGRTEKRNARVGGSPDSKHLGFWAVDVVLDKMVNAHIVNFVRACREAGLHPVFEENHVHVQFFPVGLAPEKYFRGGR